MANVHKAHKSSKKYSFQRNTKKTRNWLIAIAVVIVAIIVGVVVYNNSLEGTIKVSAPAEASLTNIADNWNVLASYTDKFTANTTANEDGTESTTLIYFGSENADAVYVYINPVTDGPISNEGIYVRPSIFETDLGQLFSGDANLSDTTVVMQAGNEKCVVYLEDYAAETLDDSAMTAVIAELEGIIAAGPAVVETPAEETPAEETPAEETPAEETPAEETPAEETPAVTE